MEDSNEIWKILKELIEKYDPAWEVTVLIKVANFSIPVRDQDIYSLEVHHHVQGDDLSPYHDFYCSIYFDGCNIYINNDCVLNIAEPGAELKDILPAVRKRMYPWL